MMTSKLTSAYGSFFTRAAKFAISPYTYAFFDTCGIPRENQSDTAWLMRLMIGGPVCVILTAVPVLPILTLMTTSLALLGFVMAALSAMIAYPVALAIDSKPCFSPTL